MILLDAGASPHLSNAKGETPLDVAAMYGKLEVVSFLIDHDNTVIASVRTSLYHVQQIVKNVMGTDSECAAFQKKFESL